MKTTIRKIISGIVSIISLPQSVQDFLMWPVATRLLGSNYTEKITLKNGVNLYGSMHDILTRNILFLGERHEYFWEPITTQLAEKLVKDATTTFIAGSHAGYDVFTLANNTNGTVHTFEPVRELYELVAKSKEANPELNVVANHMALSNVDGIVPIKNDAIRSMVVNASEATEEVRATTVKTYIEKHSIDTIDVMLLDVEGHELPVLQAMKFLLSARNAPDIIYEVVLRGNESYTDSVAPLLESLGYTTYIIQDNYHGNQTMPQEVVITQHKDMLSSGVRYVNVLATKKDVQKIEQLGIRII